MLKVKLTNGSTHEVELNGQGGTLDGAPFGWDVLELRDNVFHVVKDNRSFNVEILKADKATKTFSLRVNNNKYTLQAEDRFDALLKQLGMDNLAGSKVNVVKAPMPGLVLDIRVSEGQEVKKGDPLVVLEAMKMENILKSPADGVVKKIAITKGQAVEKNQVMINFG